MAYHERDIAELIDALSQRYRDGEFSEDVYRASLIQFMPMEEAAEMVRQHETVRQQFGSIQRPPAVPANRRRYRHCHQFDSEIKLTAREKWQQHVATALTDWRLFSIGPRPNIRYEEQLIRSGISEILAIRLEEAYAPIFRILQRIEGKVGTLANLRAEPWAGPNHQVNRNANGPSDSRSGRR